MGVQLREKKMKNGQISFYLDIYHNKARWYEFLDIHINKNKPSQQDKEKKRLAQEIKVKREHELIVQDNGLVDKSKRKADFMEWYNSYIKAKKNQNSHLKSTFSNLEKYLGAKPLPFTAITPDWIKTFTIYLQSKVSNNSARLYLSNFFTALEEAVRKDIIPLNPFRKLQRNERLKQKSTFRRAFTIDELQKLSDTPYNINKQYKQAYLYACFSGLRWSDVNPLRWSEIIIKTINGKEEWFMYFEQEKTKEIEYLPISDQAIEILRVRKTEAMESMEKSIYVFPQVKEYCEKNRLMNKKVNRYLKKWAEAAGFDPKRMHFHTGRHTFATNVLENSPDADLWTVSKLLGHKSVQPTMIYAHVRDSRKKSAIKALPMLNLKPPTAA